MGQKSLFDVPQRLESLSRLGDPLDSLKGLIPWETFRPELSRLPEKERKSTAGRKPIDAVLMFKTLVLQSLYNLADEQVEFQIRDRLSFMGFLGLGIEDRVPDATPVWRFRERLKELELMEFIQPLWRPPGSRRLPGPFGADRGCDAGAGANPAQPS